MNPLETLLQLLSEQAGPRGSTFAGRVVPQGQQPDLKTLMTQLPNESPDAEGLAGLLAIAPQVMRVPGGGVSEGVKATVQQGIKEYHVIDRQTGRVVGKYGPKRLRMANNKADQLDMDYGGSRYHVRPIMEGAE